MSSSFSKFTALQVQRVRAARGEQFERHQRRALKQLIFETIKEYKGKAAGCAMIFIQRDQSWVSMDEGKRSSETGGRG
jgi:hypothetical protein